MSEEALLEEDIWEYRSVRKRKRQSASERPSAPLRKVTEGRGRLKRRNGNKRKSVGKNGDLQESEPTSRPNEDPEASKDDSSLLSQESAGSQAEHGTQSARPVHDGHCPSCQMPFTLLRVQTPRWHVAECLDTPGATEKECPDGLLCTSTIPSHYKRYSHFLLAASRAGEYLVSSSAHALEGKSTCSTAAKSGCFPSHSEEISQNEKQSNNVKNILKYECASTVQSSPQKKTLNITSESTSSFAHAQNSQQTFQFTQTTDNSCKFEFYDFASSQESVTGEDLSSQKDTNQPSLLQSKVDFSDCEISYSPLSTCEESEEETDEEEKKAKISQNELFKGQNFEDTESDSVEVKKCNGLLLQQKHQYKHIEQGNFVLKKQHCEEANTWNCQHYSGIAASQSHVSSNFCNSACVGNQHHQEALVADSSFPFSCELFEEEVQQPGLISSAADAGNADLKGSGACALDSVCVGLTGTPLVAVGEGAGSPLSQKSKVRRDPSNGLTDPGKMAASAIEKAAHQESSQSVVKKEEKLNAADVCFPSPVSKTVSSHPLASVNAKSSSAKELKQMDIGVFFGLKPKVKEESKREVCLSEEKQTPSSGTPNGKRPRQQKRKAEGSVEDIEGAEESSNKNGELADVTSGGRRKWRKKFRELPATGEGARKKQCPFYKKIPGTGFTVDAFQYGEIEGCTAYFLTHFHSDHYCGLTKNFMFPIYCNKITGNLVKSKLRVKEQYVHVLPMDTECVVNGIKVVLLDANHCPGATMILFCLPSGTAILHTGDFRADPSMQRYPALLGQKVHTLYLDTTYCSPEYTFPSQQEVIQFAVNTAFETVTLNPRTLVVCGTYSIGKEKVFLAIAEVLGSKASMSRDKYKTLQCLESAAVNSLISVDWAGTLLHILPMMQITFKGLQDHLNKFSENFDQVLAFKPTGWTYSDSCLSLLDIKPQTRGRITIYGIPYSEHSSYLEMKRFVQWLKPQKIIPTVNVGDWRARSLMEKHFRDWMTEGSGHK
ncbi:DNA cross-link repair 1A protein isoform X2 [Aythya fuligula]|uniref:DNA cross-link repair 1A protein n=1 Tax=Aythya fuligula TaxID=219594 RepID=A0A6J3DDJ5_AYTFU|nr:DNA cross-link repair 1A protein isoform X2 [Aythya fuligula]